MSNKNYNKISTNKIKETKVEIEEEIPVVEPIVEEEIPVVEPIVEEETAEEPIANTKNGIVVGCSFLNIRNNPSVSAEIVGILSKDDKVVIHDEIGDFYKIGNPDGNEFCMKKYISIN